MSTSILILIAVLAMGIQCTLAGVIHLAGAKLDLMPAMVTYAALTASWSQALVVAVTCGLLLDMFSFPPLGLSVPPLIVAAMLINHFQKLLYRDHALVQGTLAGATSLGVSLWTGLLLRASDHPLPFDWRTALKMLLIAALAAVVAPAWCWLLDHARRPRADEPMEVETF
jgi:rod shape-determining protein MreD